MSGRVLRPAEQRAAQNGWGHPGWERYNGPYGGRPEYDADSAIVTVKEPGKYRVTWEVGANRFKLVPVELDF